MRGVRTAARGLLEPRILAAAGLLLCGSALGPAAHAQSFRLGYWTGFGEFGFDFQRQDQSSPLGDRPLFERAFAEQRLGLNNTATIGVGNGLSSSAGQLLIGITRTSNTLGNVTLLNEGLVAVGFLTNVVGSASSDFPIPFDRNLCGQKLYLQAFFVDPSVQGTFPISHTDGIEWTLGN